MSIQTLKTNHVAQLMALGIAGVLIDRLAAVVHDVRYLAMGIGYGGYAGFLDELYGIETLEPVFHLLISITGCHC